MHPRHRRALALLGMVTVSHGFSVAAQEAAGGDEPPGKGAEEEAGPTPERVERDVDDETARRSLNVLATLFQIPIAHNFEWGLGAKDEGFRYLLTARPRIPIVLAREWMLITTAFTRFQVVEDVIAPDGTGAGSHVGMGNSELYALVTPPRWVDELLFGLGPFAIFPSGNPRFGSLNMGVGPGGAVSWQGQGVVLNLVILHAFSFADDENDYSETQLLPTVSYVFDTGTAIVLQSETVHEWISDVWIVPLNLGVNQVISPGPLLRMSIGVQGKWWPVSPAGGPNGGMRFITTLLFPDLESGGRDGS